MKKLVTFLLLASFTLSAQELGLETDSGTVRSLEEELLLIGEDDLLVEDIVISEPIETIVAEETTTDTTATDDSLTTEIEEEIELVAETDVNDTVDTAEVAEVEPLVDSAAIAMTSATSVAVSAVDIEKSLTGYKSPRRAMFFSLALPGAGQAYVGRYWKTGLFVALEAAAIAGAVKFKKDGEELQDKAYDYFDDHFSVDTLETFLEDLTAYGYAHSKYTDKPWEVDSVLFGNAYTDTSKGTSVEQYIKDVNTNVYFYGKQETALQGWRDASPTYITGNPSEFYQIDGTGMLVDENALTLTGGDTRFGSSEYRLTYLEKLEESEKKFDASRTMVIGIVVNHVASAVDAYITAVRYNRALMGEQNTIMSHLSVDNQLYVSETGALTTGVSLSWKF